jgi:hypothetical protein
MEHECIATGIPCHVKYTLTHDPTFFPKELKASAGTSAPQVAVKGPEKHVEKSAALDMSPDSLMKTLKVRLFETLQIERN